MQEEKFFCCCCCKRVETKSSLVHKIFIALTSGDRVNVRLSLFGERERKIDLTLAEGKSFAMQTAATASEKE